MRSPDVAVDDSNTEPPTSQGEEQGATVMDLVTYWQRFCAPFLRARFGRTERGASLVEYALLVALIAVVCIVAVSILGQNASKKFSSVGSALT
jgi:pilus assembly protein Flp/PilA